MTETMIGRVARAILAKVPSGYGMTAAEAMDYARAAIVAMREPTDEQYKAALEFGLARMKEYGVDGLSPFKDYPPLRGTTIGMFQAMIDEALADKPKGE